MKDSIDKIVTVYFWGVTKKPFEYKGRLYSAKPLHISSTLFRDYTCPAGCGACCLAYTMDYLPSEPRPKTIARGEKHLLRTVMFDGREVQIYSDMQTSHESSYCRNLRKEDGRCTIHPQRAFSCDIEMVRFSHFKTRTYIGQRLYGRGWRMRRITDGLQGALCTMLPVSELGKQEVARKFERLLLWTRHFGLESWVPEILDWIKSGGKGQPVFQNKIRQLTIL